MKEYYDPQSADGREQPAPAPAQESPAPVTEAPGVAEVLETAPKETDLKETAPKEPAAKESAPVREPIVLTELPPAPPLQEQTDLDPASERVTVCDVQFRSGSKIYYFDPGQLAVKAGDHLIIDTARGAEYGSCVAGPHRVPVRELVQPLRRVLRVATAIDERIKADNERLEKDAYAFCYRKVEELGLDMQMVSTECAFDGSKLLFYFTADARVDFRELVKILASNYHTRIELRQIGVRDKAKLLGGLGICGRPFCCASFLEDFQPVSIKMAKTQNLSLNPTKISGTCGRLMCCLKYEQDAYEDLIQSSPKAESFVDTPDGRGTVTGINLMRQSVSVRMEHDPEEIRCYKNCDICVLRSGKAKKTDPPIPEDLAPISGRRDADPLAERRSLLEQRLVAEIEEEPEQISEPEAEPERAQPLDENAARSRRNRRDRRQNREEQPEKTPEAGQPEKPAQEKKPGEGAGSSRRNRKGRQREKERRQPEQAERQEKPERPDRPEQQEKASRSQRRRRQQGKPEPKLPQVEPPRRQVPEKAGQAGQPAPKPEGKKNNKRRYYHNRKPKG